MVSSGSSMIHQKLRLVSVSVWATLTEALPTAADFFVPSLPGIPDLATHPTCVRCRDSLTSDIQSTCMRATCRRTPAQERVVVRAVWVSTRRSCRWNNPEVTDNSFMMAKARRSAGKQRVIFWFNVRLVRYCI